MKEEVAKKLVEAVRSGKYKQTRGCLKKITRVIEHGVVVDHDRPCFCILGVLCDIFAEEHEFAKWEPVIIGGKVSREVAFVSDVKQGCPWTNLKARCIKSESTLPSAVVEWSGLQTGDGVFEVTNDMAEDLPGEVGKTQCLMNLNDDYYWSLEQIADFVEKHWMHI